MQGRERVIASSRYSFRVSPPDAVQTLFFSIQYSTGDTQLTGADLMLQERAVRLAFSPLPSSEQPTLQLRDEVKRQAQERIGWLWSSRGEEASGC